MRDATVLLVGRGGAYPALSVALGERMGVVGALSIEAAAKHLNTRDIDGIVLGEGFTDRVVDAFLTVLSEDPRFRHLPVVATLAGLVPAYDLPNLEICHRRSRRCCSKRPAPDPAARVRSPFEPHAAVDRRRRPARSAHRIADGHALSIATLRPPFVRRLPAAADCRVARFAFDPANSRARLDGARLLSRLMRQMDFGTLRDDGSALVVFAETDLRTAHIIARRLFSVMRHTAYDNKDSRRNEPVVSVATLMPQDTVQSLLARLDDEGRRAAS